MFISCFYNLPCLLIQLVWQADTWVFWFCLELYFSFSVNCFCHPLAVNSFQSFPFSSGLLRKLGVSKEKFKGFSLFQCSQKWEEVLEQATLCQTWCGSAKVLKDNFQPSDHFVSIISYFPPWAKTTFTIKNWFHWQVACLTTVCRIRAGWEQFMHVSNHKTGWEALLPNPSS